MQGKRDDTVVKVAKVRNGSRTLGIFLKESSNPETVLEYIKTIPQLSTSQNPELLEQLYHTKNPKIWRAAYAKFSAEDKLLAAAYFGWEHTVSHLIKQGNNVNIHDARGASPLYYAAQNGHVACVSKLLKAHADVNCRSPLYSFIDQNKVHALIVRLEQGMSLDVVSPLYAATKAGHHGVMELLLMHQASSSQLTAYGHALALGLYDCSATIAKRLGHMQNEHHPYTALHVAAGNGDIKAMRLLLQYGADENYSATFTVEGDFNCFGFSETQYTASTPLHHAVAQKQNDAVDFLIHHGGAVNQRACDKLPNIRTDGEVSDDGIGLTPLHVAAKEGTLGSVNLLLQYGAKVNALGRRPAQMANMYFPEAHTPLDMGITHNDTAQALIKKGAKLTHLTQSIETVIESDQGNMLHLLLQSKSYWSSRQLAAFMDIAVNYNKIESVKELLNHGAKISDEMIQNARDCNYNDMADMLTDYVMQNPQAGSFVSLNRFFRAAQQVPQSVAATSAPSPH